MSDNRWQKVEEIFEKAVELDGDARASYLTEACGTDTELRKEVEDLIRADSDAEDFIESPIVGENTLASLLPDTIEDSVAPHFLGKRVGAYELIRELGRGGMGAVFLAQRADDEFRKRVAIKLIKRGMDTDFILKRFRNERQILATLDHPNIARLLDGGTTEDGLPYFVMEYIEGEPIHFYADSRRLSIRERLQLFQQVCSAVNYAHQNMIIHRDLKPGNILVTKDRTPKLLDFGIAKILNPELAADTLSPTVTGMRLMTPEYASPEQIRGEILTQSSDIYSLGILLYELLTDKRPYRLGSRYANDVARIICEEPPESPASVIANDDLPSSSGKNSTLETLSRNRRTSPEDLRRDLSGDLQNILLKAIRKSPNNRYPSAEDFSRDIQSFLDGMPVSAPALPSTDERFEDSIYPKNSLAVLPFQFLHIAASETTESDEYMAIGLADTLITRLSHLKTVSVRPTSAVIKYATQTTEPEAAGRELNVANVLDGRIQQFGNRVRVTAQLIRINTNETIWAGQFEEQGDDFLSIQDSISAQVAQALVSQLTGEERERLERRGTNNAKAYEAYVKGRYYWHTYAVDGMAKALVCFYEAIALDPDFALPYSGVADYFNFLSVFGIMSPQESFPAAREAALKAVKLDPELAEAYVSLGIIAFGHDWDLKESERLFTHALDLNPNYGGAHLWYAHLLSLKGEHKNALREMKMAEMLNPQSASLLVSYAFALRNARKFDNALEKIKQAMALQPNYYVAAQGYAWVVKWLKNFDEAERACQQAVEQTDRLNLPLYAYGYVLAAAGKSDQARSILAELIKRKATQYVPAIYPALINTALGEIDAAFEWLNRAIDEHDFWAAWIPIDPRFDTIRDDPRYQVVLERIRPSYDTDDIHGSHVPTKELPPSDVKGERPAALAAKRSPLRYVAFAAAAVLLGIVALVAFFGDAKFSYIKINRPTHSTANDPAVKSLVILPFVTDSHIENEESFGVGLAESLSKKLAQVNGISSHIAMQKGLGQLSPKEIAKDHGAAYLVRGNLHVVNDNVRVTVELLNAPEDKMLWLETFDEKLSGFPALQVTIAERILKALTVELTAGDKQKIGKIYTKNSEAYQLYLVGRYEMSKRTPENLHKAILSFNQAIEKDKNFALAYVGLADANALLNLYQTPPPPEGYSKAREYAQKAVALDGDLAEGYASLGFIKLYGDQKIAESEALFRKAIQMNPAYENAHHWLALALSTQGKHDEAIAEINIARQLSPRSVAIVSAAGIINFFARRFDEAVTESTHALEIDQGSITSIGTIRWVATLQGDYMKAMDYYQKEKMFSGGAENATNLISLAQVQAGCGQPAKALETLKKAFADKDFPKVQHTSSYDIGLVYILLGDEDQAFEWIKKAVDSHRFNYVNVDPRLDKFRSASRFKELLKSSPLS